MKRSIWTGILAGAAAGAAGSLAMNQFQRLAAVVRGGREADDATIGLPRTGRGPQPAQAIGNASDDATVRVANATLATVGRELTEPRSKQLAGEFVHLAFGALNGALYGAAVEINPRLRRGGGVPFGLAVWALADEGIVPALGLSRSARRPHSDCTRTAFFRTSSTVRRRSWCARPFAPDPSAGADPAFRSPAWRSPRQNHR
ncbi:MAG: DUF1440 domain-containing protein [Cyanobacteria bacterium]|nr:DUF1440 domain-containing protein [Cyanobacteriota bacterium]